MARSKSHGREDRKQKAIENAEKRSQRTPHQQLKHLDKILGKNKGAIKERARLKKLVTIN